LHYFSLCQAKSLGIKNGEPFFKIKNNPYYSSVHFFSSNYALYADLSDRVMQTLTAMSPSIEIYSIDEAFINLSGVMNCVPLSTFGHEIRTNVLKYWLNGGRRYCANQTLAKLANHAAKTWRGTGGVVDLSILLRQRRLLALVPVEEVWGVGRKMSKT
jgi:DNA polymerase V